MRRRIAWTAVAALLLLGTWGCGASARASYRDSSSDEFRSGYGYGEMFADAEGERDRGERAYGSPGSVSTESVAAPEPMASYEMEEEAPPAEMMPADAPTTVTATGGAGGYAFEDDAIGGALDRPASSPPAPPARVQLAEAARPAPTPAPARPSGAGEGGGGEAPPQVADAGSSGPLLIYEAGLNLAVHQVREKMADVIAIADDLGGFLQRQDDTTVIIRVPAQRFREALARVEAVGDVLNRRVTAEDVTERFRDVRIRLRNATEMRDRMAELLQRADTVPDSLTIQRELERLTQEIELYRGQLRALEDRIAFSTITVIFQPIRVDAEVPRESFRLPFPWLDRLGLPHLMELR